MAPQVITRPGPFGAPLDLDLGALDVLTPESAFAHFDGTGAGGSFLPALTYYTQDGKIFSRAIGEVVAAGASADVSWFPGLSVSAPGASGGGFTASAEQVNQSAVSVSIANSTTTTILPTNHLSGPLLWTPSGGGMTCLASGFYSVSLNMQLASATWTAGGGFEVTLALSSYSFVDNAWVTFPTVTADVHFPGSIQANVQTPILHFLAGDKFFPIVLNLDGAAARSFQIQLCSIFGYS